MGKVITVWGSPGSGKSMFSCILAKALTRDKRKAIIINAEISVPMLPVWLPEQIIQTNASVGQVLSSVEIDTSLVAGHVTVLKSYPFIGVMGYAAGENPLSYPEVKYAMVLQLVNAAARLVDFVILDCSSNMTNVFTPAAIESGDLVIRILTPDLKGVMEQVEYHSVSEYPAKIIFFADGEVYEIIYAEPGKEQLINQMLSTVKEVPPKYIVLIEQPEQIAEIRTPNTSGYCTVSSGGEVQYYQIE